ncbi:MAG: PRC-barrel domain-containing protein [Candidatus Gracilibacteria bacterium]
MVKGHDVIGKSVIAYDSGTILTKVKDILFNAQENIILGFQVSNGSPFSEAKAIPFRYIKAIGPNAITVESDSVIVPSSEDRQIKESLENNSVKGKKVMTEDGKDLGVIADIYFREDTGTIEGYEVSGGIFSDADTGISFLPAPAEFSIGEDVAFVPSAMVEIMRNPVHQGEQTNVPQMSNNTFLQH